ncbi:MAG: sulfotransferase domain-containing protein [Hyphomicrobiales bacterium]|nr:sulfotransferase domain-containing protein [Hyphomicrobiales bacterium]MCP5370477.1 sulfotransferase domain-containing protein [Hyphomicrobiales bacterium]
MSHILWLASFPKSGNTWVRAFLANFLSNGETPVDVNALPNFAMGDANADDYAQAAGKPVEALTAADLNRLRPAVHQRIAAARPGLVFVKTHSVLAKVGGVPTITPGVTAAAIYIVRNPLDVAVSMAYHYGYPVADAVGGVCFDELEILPTGGRIPQRVTSWGNHLRSWRAAPGLNVCLLRYEDMLADPETNFAKVTAFLGLPGDRDRLRRAVRHSSFKILAQQERDRGFVESSQSPERFFRRGQAGGWRDELTAQQVAEIVEKNRDAMVEMGYLSPQGEILV